MSEWLQVTPDALLAVALLLVPGLPAVWLLGVRGFAALATAPLVSVSLVGVLGEVCALVGVPWGLLPLLAATVLAAVVGLVVGRLLRHDTVEHDSWRHDLTALGATALGAVLVLSAALPAMRGPHRYPQAYDTSFHLNLIEWMTQHHDVAATHGQAFFSPTGKGFYPAAFHAVAATMDMITGSGPLVAGNVLNLVVSAGLWVLGCVLLVRQLVGRSRLALWVTGVTSAMFSAFPYWFMGHGVHWPNSLAYALLAPALACLLAAIGPVRHDVIGRRRGLVLAVAGVPGIGIAHPNAFIALVVVFWLLLSLRLLPSVPRWVRERRWLSGAGTLAFVLLLPVLGLLATRVVPILKSVSTFDWPAKQRLPQAIGEVAMFATGGHGVSWVAVALVVTGIVVLSRRGGPWWPVAVTAVFAALFALASGTDAWYAQLLTGPWYNDPGRLASLVPLGAVPLATLGVVALVRALARPRLPVPVAAVIVLVAVVVATGGLYHRNHVDDLIAYHQPSPTQTYATAAEQRALTRLGRELPKDAIVASNPWNGSQLVYALTGRRVLFAHFKPSLTPDRLMVAEHADEAASDPRVCSSLHILAVTHVITYDKPVRFWRWSPRTKQYPGLDDVAGKPGYTLVDRAGPYALWKLTAC